MHSGRMFKARHISPLPPGERGRGRGPEVADQHGTSDGPDHLRPLPTRAALTLSPEGEGAVRRGLLLQGWSQDCTFLPNCQTVQSMHSGRMFKARHISPLPPGERGRGRGPEVTDQHGTSYGADNLRPLPRGRGDLWDSARSLSRLLFLWAFILHGLLLELRQGIPFQVRSE